MSERSRNQSQSRILAPLAAGERLLNVDEVAQVLGCARSTVWRWARCGIIAPPLRIFGSSRWRPADLHAVIQSAEEARTNARDAKNDNLR